MLKEKTVGQIRYTKEKDGSIEVSERSIVPTLIPKSNIKAIDVSDLSEEQREELIEFYTEYQKYYKIQLKTIFSFEDWIDATHADSDLSSGNKKVEIKYRTFKMDNIQLVE